jgi:hypothetical protein
MVLDCSFSSCSCGYKEADRRRPVAFSPEEKITYARGPLSADGERACEQRSDQEPIEAEKRTVGALKRKTI